VYHGNATVIIGFWIWELDLFGLHLAELQLLVTQSSSSLTCILTPEFCTVLPGRRILLHCFRRRMLTR
jgi:hypothetical protein